MLLESPVALRQEEDLVRRLSRNYGDTMYNGELFYIQDYSPMRDTYISVLLDTRHCHYVLLTSTRYGSPRERQIISSRVPKSRYRGEVCASFQTDCEKRKQTVALVYRNVVSYTSDEKSARSVRMAEIIL